MALRPWLQKQGSPWWDRKATWRPRPGGDPLLLGLARALRYYQNRFLVQEGQVDLLRTTLTEAAGATPLKNATAFKLVVNVFLTGVPI